MATIEVNFNVTDIASVLSVFDVAKVYRSTTGDDGPYAEITTPANRVVLEPTILNYTFIDTTGENEYFYRISYFNSTTSLESSLSEPQQGAGAESLDILSVEELKTNYLFGVDLTDDQGNPYPDSMFEFYIKAAVDRMEKELDLPLRKQVICEERHDYYREDYDKYIWVELNEYPVIAIQEVKLVLPGEQVVQVFDKDWIHIQRNSGQLQLVPGTGTAGSILLGASGAWLPLIYGNNRFIPDVFRVSYTAGFGAPPAGSINPPIGSNPPSISVKDAILDRGLPDDIRHAIGMMSAIGPFNVAGDLLGGAGIASQSLGIDALSQSFSTTSSATNAGYGARILQYERELKTAIPLLKKYYKGWRMRAV